jgi:hypothetical protein
LRLGVFLEQALIGLELLPALLDSAQPEEGGAVDVPRLALSIVDRERLRRRVCRVLVASFAQVDLGESCERAQAARLEQQRDSELGEGIACWFIDTDYNEESFFVRHAYFLGANDPYKSLKTTLKAEIDPDAWDTLHSDTSRPFEKPKSGRIAVKVINQLGDEVMKVFRT